MRVFVTGGTGFVGPAIVRALLADGHQVTALVHRSKGTLEGAAGDLTFVTGDVTNPHGLADHMAGHDAVVHLVAIRRAFPHRGITFERFHTEATANVVQAAQAASVPRLLFMSASGDKTNGTGYQRTKAEAEALVRGSGLAWTIFRPTFVTGPREGNAEGFEQEFARIVKMAPILPGFGGGKFLMQPVAKRDVAAAFAAALKTDKAHGSTYFLAGAEVFTWNAYLHKLADSLGKRRVVMPVPLWLITPVARLLERFSWFPASRDELVNLAEGHAGDSSPAQRDLGLDWMPFDEALDEALAELK